MMRLKKEWRVLAQSPAYKHPPVPETQTSGMAFIEVEMTHQREQPAEVAMTQREEDREQRLFTFKTTQLIWLAFGLVEVLIVMRIILKLIGANATNLFAAFIYDVSYIFLFPFEGLVGTPTTGSAVLELSSIIAMFVYILLAWGIERIVRIFFYRPRR
jgi:hypothetical protein